MKREILIQERLTRSIIGAFYETYNVLGYGFLETVYEKALDRELRARGHSVGRQVLVNVMYKGEALATQKIDMLVDESVVVEVKATRELHDSASRQLLNYLAATNLEVGLLLHFGPKARFHRLINTTATASRIRKSAKIRGNP